MLKIIAMTIDSKKYLQKLRGEDAKRGRVTLYLDKDIYEKFRKACDDIAPSKVVELFMKDFLDSAKSKETK